MHDPVFVQVVDRGQNLETPVGQEFLGEAFAVLDGSFDVRVQVALFAVLEDEVEDPVFDHGVDVLDNVLVLDFFEEDDFLDCQALEGVFSEGVEEDFFADVDWGLWGYSCRGGRGGWGCASWVFGV